MSPKEARAGKPPHKISPQPDPVPTHVWPPSEATPSASSPDPVSLAPPRSRPPSPEVEGASPPSTRILRRYRGRRGGSHVAIAAIGVDPVP